MVDLWCHVGACADALTQVTCLAFLCETEIDDLDVHFVIKKHVIELQVPMHYVFRMQEFNSVEKLAHKKPSYAFTHRTTTFAEI